MADIQVTTGGKHEFAYEREVAERIKREKGEVNEKVENEATIEQPGSDSAEIQMTTFVIDGKPMSFEEMQAYQAAEDARMANMRAIMDAEEEERRADRLKHGY